MKVYVTARFKGALEQREAIEALCRAVRDASMEDFCFIRDIENYRKIFHDPKELWQRSREELRACDALLIDVSDMPTTGRVIEAGMAYAWKLPIFVIAKNNIEYKDAYNGIAARVIRYSSLDNVTTELKDYLENSQS